MLEIKEGDFRSIDSFELRWRWTDSVWNKLPDDALKNIRPLAEAKARELNEYSLQFCDNVSISESSFEHTEQVDASADESLIKRWLVSCSSSVDESVVVSWNKDLAALVKWEVFCEFWDDFCYPSSDDVTVFPLSGEWMLFYSHSAYFVFGQKPKPDGAV